MLCDGGVCYVMVVYVMCWWCMLCVGGCSSAGMSLSDQSLDDTTPEVPRVKVGVR